jgi:hypothetical protein
MINRNLLEQAFPGQPRLQREFEEQAKTVDATAATVASSVGATEALQDATVITLSANAAFTNERVLRLGHGLESVTDDSFVTISVDPTESPHVEGGFSVTFRSQGVTDIVLPTSGTLATRAGSEKLSNKTLETLIVLATDYANDAAAAAGGVPINGVYRTAGALKVRIS